MKSRNKELSLPSICHKYLASNPDFRLSSVERSLKGHLECMIGSENDRSVDLDQIF